VGAGAGFPSLPLKICFPHLKVTLVDSLKKRTDFLQHLVNQLDLTNVSIYHDRAETFAQQTKQREKYDMVTARAVAPLSILAEFCLPLVRKEGTMIAMKGSSIDGEIEDARYAIQRLGGSISHIEKLQLPGKGHNQRHIIYLMKKHMTP